MENSVIESIIKDLISEEKIEEVLREEIRSRIDYHFDKILEKEAERMVKKFSDELIVKKLDELLGRKVLINDGFGSRKEYADFDAFVTDYIGRHVKSSYELERKVQQMVKDRLERYCKEVVSEANCDLTEKVIEKIANDKTGYVF